MSTDLNFTHKWVRKRQYQKTYKAKDVVEEVFDKFDDYKANLKEISDSSGVPYRTIVYWHRRYIKDNSYRPGSLIGQHRRRFTVEEESHVADFIKTQFVDSGVPVHPKHLRATLNDCWKSLDLDKRNELDTKNYFSYAYLKDFCKRNNLSFRTMRKKKRSLILDREVNEFFEKRADIFRKYTTNRIGNMDETPWNFVYLRGKVLAHKGVEEVSATLPADYRSCFTVIATILADGTKLPPIFLAQGKTSSCHGQFAEMKSDTDKYELFHSPGKNTNDATMLWYLQKYHQWMNKEPSALILDRYTSHISDSTIEKAAELQIELIFIPTSATDKYQPLDKYIFGVMKSSAAAECNDKLFNEQSCFSKSQAADVFVRHWENLRVATVKKAWESTTLEHAFLNSSDDDSDSSDSETFPKPKDEAPKELNESSDSYEEEKDE